MSSSVRVENDGRRFAVIIAICAGCFMLYEANATVLAQDAATDEQIRQGAQKILAEPEFQYFDQLGDMTERPDSRSGFPSSSFGSGDGSGSDGTGSSSGSGGKNGRNGAGNSSSGHRGNPDRGSNSGSSSGSSTSSSSSSFSSGFAAIGQTVGLIFHFLAYLVLIAVCGLIIYLIVLAVMNWERPSAKVESSLPSFDLPEDEDHSPGELPADAYLAKSHELAQQGRYREAVGQLLWGGMSSIERAQLIRHRRGLTLRDYLRSLRGKSSHYNGFKILIQLYEPVGFGRRVASYQTFQDALTGYQQTVDGLT